MDKLIFKKLSGESLSEREHEILRQWIDSDSANKKVFFQLRVAFMKTNPDKIGKVKDEVWEDLLSGQQIKRRGFPFLKWVASILIVLSIGTLIYFQFEIQRTQISESPGINYLEKVCQKGQKLTVSLPDGSRVKLNAGSKLIAPNKFVNERIVEIQGEAFFEVTKSEQPFIVKVGDIDVTVLGTSFNVNAYTSNHIVVAVATGKVSVSANTNDFQLTKDLVQGEQALYRQGEPILEVSEYERDEVIGWKDNLLVFRNSAFSEVTRDLNNWYNVTFIIDDTISFEETFNGAFVNPSLEEVMTSLAHLYSFEYKIDGKQITISNMN